MSDERDKLTKNDELETEDDSVEAHQLGEYGVLGEDGEKNVLGEDGERGVISDNG